MRASEMADKLVAWINTHATSAHGLLVPVSGGSDSALGFWLCRQAFPEKTVAIHAGNDLRCRDWFESIGPVDDVKTPGTRLEREEMRWARFLATSVRHRQWLVGCRNLTEHSLGTYSLASRVATFLPLIGTLKTHVMRICRAVGVPSEIIASSRRADPDCGRPQEMAEIPFEAIDRYILRRAGARIEHGLTEAQTQYLDSVVQRNAFKLALPISGPLL